MWHPSRRRGRGPSAVVLASIVAAATSGCVQDLRERELERVAKDWAQTIRASQVIPVYPLTEDLQPGDVFLVRRPIQEQHEEYEERGFLSLDQHLTRLRGLDYATIYDGSFGIGDHKNSPRHWQFPPDGTPVIETEAPVEAVAKATGESDGESEEAESTTSHPRPSPSLRHIAKTQWPLAPRAGFPTYTFHVRSGSGASVAIPVQGVPVALSLMGSGEATGSVTIADAYTYSVPYDGLVEKVLAWAAKHRPFLAEVRRGIAEGESRLHRLWRHTTKWLTGARAPDVYVRVIHRVYLAGRVVVELKNDENVAGRLSGGFEKSVEIPELEAGEVLANYASALRTLEAKLDETLPGGTLKFAWATRRSVSMTETFERPLVVGFLGFDFPVLDGGFLGAPVATLDQVSNRSLAPEAIESERLVDSSKLRDVRISEYERLGVSDESAAKDFVERIDAAAAALLPPRYPIEIYDSAPRPEGAAVDAASLATSQEKGAAIGQSSGFRALVTYQDALSRSAEVLEESLSKEQLFVDGDEIGPERRVELKETLRSTRAEIGRLRDDSELESALVEASRYLADRSRKS